MTTLLHIVALALFLGLVWAASSMSIHNYKVGRITGWELAFSILLHFGCGAAIIALGYQLIIAFKP